MFRLSRLFWGRRQVMSWGMIVVALCGVGLVGCEGCEKEKKVPALKLPFSDDFNQSELKPHWYTEASGRWRVSYDKAKKQGKLCVDLSKNNPLFLNGTLPEDVVVEFDAWAMERNGDVKMEIFTDGRYHASGYVLVHGGWKNTWSIIDRLDEHNKSRRQRRGGPKKGVRYHWKVVRVGDTLSWYLNDKLYMTYKDKAPLRGKNHTHFAFSNWEAYVCFDNLKIYAAPKRAARPASVKETTKVAANAADDDNDQADDDDDQADDDKPQLAARQRPALRLNPKFTFPRPRPMLRPIRLRVKQPSLPKIQLARPRLLQIQSPRFQRFAPKGVVKRQ